MSDLRPDPHAATLSGDDPALANTLAAVSDPARDDTHDSDGSRPSIVGERPSSTLTAEHPGRYRRVGEIGRGGMGRVILALDEHLGREVAMKELLTQGGAPGVGMSVGAVARFLREARITGQLEHPSIVPVHELGQRADGTIYYTMKRIRGRSLASVLADAKSAPERLTVMSAYRDVCQAIAYAHARGVVHRDLKPDNVMLGEFGETLVVDWGLAKVRGENDPRAIEIERRVELLKGADAAHTLGGHAIGTPAYMSPEQARGDLDSIDERSDVWGLGAMLFEILTGRPPYVGSSAFDVLQQVLESPVARVRTIAPDAPPELAAIADRALTRDPSSRYPGARELADEIAAWQDGRTVRAYEYSSWDLVRRFVRRNRAGTIAAVAILGASLLATAIVSRSFVSEQSARALAERREGEARAERERAVGEARRAGISLAEALLEQGERALAEGDPAAAAIYAAAALVRDPARDAAPRWEGEPLDDDARREASQRADRAHSLFAEAEAAHGWMFERTLAGIRRDAVIAPDGSALVALAPGGLVRVDASSGERTSIAIDGAIEQVVGFVGASRVVLRGAVSGVYSLATGTLAYPTVDPLASSHVAGRLAVVGRDGTIVIHDAETGAELERIATEHGAGVGVLLSPDAAGVAALGRTQGVVDVWALPGASAPVRHELGGWARDLAFSPDGTALALTLDAADVRIITLADGAATRVPTDAWAQGVAWLGSERMAVLEGAEVVLRRTDDGRPLERLHVPGAARMVQGGSRIVALPETDGGEARVFREVVAPSLRRTGHEARAVGAIVHGLAWDPTRSRVVGVAGRDVIAIEVRRHRLGPPSVLATLPADQGLGHDLDVAEDGAIVVGTRRGSVVLVLPDGTTRVLSSEPSMGSSIAIAWDAEGRVALVSRGGEAGLRRVTRDGEPRPELRTDAPVQAIARSHDGQRIATAESDGDVRILDAHDPTRVVRVLRGHERLAAGVAFSPDDQRIATTDGVGHVRVYEVDTGRLLASERVHEGAVGRLDWSPDGRQLVTASVDGTVRVLASDTLRAWRILRTSGATSRAVLTQDGDLVALDGAAVLLVQAVPPHRRDDPAQLLAQAEARAGVRLVGMDLLAAE